MTYGKSRNVIVVKNINSSYVEPAILILKKETDSKEYYGSGENIVLEAQRIIDQYVQNQQNRKQSKKGHSLRFLSICAAATLLLSITIFILLKF